MRILAIADQESRALWDFYNRERTEGVDLIISCGDLSPDYLEFLETMVNCPLLYVKGNHDGRYADHPPGGCIDIDGRVYDYKGLRILGLGGCLRYRPGNYMYTEEEMCARIRGMRRQIRRAGGIDILVTHAPAAGYGDLEDPPHRGYRCFNRFLEEYQPRYMLHGHVHQSYGHFVREREHPCGTKLINCYDRYTLDIAPEEYASGRSNGSGLFDLYSSLGRRLGRNRGQEQNHSEDAE